MGAVGTVSSIKAYIARKGLEPTTFKLSKRVGYVGEAPEIKENWVPIDKAVNRTKGAVASPTIHPEVLDTFEPERDGL